VRHGEVQKMLKAGVRKTVDKLPGQSEKKIGSGHGRDLLAWELVIS
jgi:hypothetical protein